jgi:S1-C subfamily serine protease
VLASAQDIDNAIGIARNYGSDASVYLSSNGWYAVALSPKEGSLDQIRKNLPWLNIPKDAFLGNSKRLNQVVWRFRSPVISQVELSGQRSASLSSGSFAVSIMREKIGNDWKVQLTGQDGGRQLFRLSHVFEDASDYGASAELVHLNKGNAFPEVIIKSYSGGAHCCTTTIAATMGASGSWQFVDLGTIDGAAGAAFEDFDGDGVSEMSQGDQSFLYLFGAYVESFEPVRISEMRDGRVFDVSNDSRFHRRLVQDAYRLDFIAKTDPSFWSSNGFLAAWVAAKSRIGQGNEAWSRMLQLYQRDMGFGVQECLTGAAISQCPRDKLQTLPFPEGLRKHLQEHGYMVPQVTAASAPAPSPPQQTSQPPATATETSLPAVTGTGFFVSDGEVLTNAHVVHGCQDVSLSYHGTGGSGSVIAQDAANDLAIIRTSLQPSSHAHIRTGIRLGEDVAAFGFPLRGLLSTSGNFTLGNVTALTGLRDNSRYLQISAPVQPGNSGGPLLDRDGNVVGIVVSKINALKLASLTDDIAQNINFAVNAAVVESFLHANNIAFDDKVSQGDLHPEDLAAKAQAMAVAIECQPR